MGATKSKSKIPIIKSSEIPITKLIFLDIDGVLNNSSSDVKQLYVMEKELLNILREIIIDVPGTAIVVSSTWRYTNTTRQKLLEFFESVGLPYYLSCTKNLGTNRDDEILHWIENTDFFEHDENWERIRPVDLASEDMGKFDSLKKSKTFSFQNTESRFKEDLPESEYTVSKLNGITHIICLDDMDLSQEPSEYKYLFNKSTIFLHVDKKVGLTLTDSKEVIRRLTI